MLQELLVNFIPKVLENFLRVLLVIIKLLFNSIVININFFNTILSLFPELLLLVHDINFVFFLPLFYFVDFILEPLEVLFDVSIDRLNISFHISYRGLKLIELLFKLIL